MGHFEPFPLPRLNGRCLFNKPTSAGASGNGKDARIPDLPALAPERGGSTETVRKDDRQSMRNLLSLRGLRHYEDFGYTIPEQ